MSEMNIKLLPAFHSTVARCQKRKRLRGYNHENSAATSNANDSNFYLRYFDASNDTK